MIVKRLCHHHKLDVFGTDLIDNPPVNALTDRPPRDFMCIVTNPPFSIKEALYSRFHSLNVPFAMLIQADWSQWILRAIKGNGCRLIVPTRRISYISPNILDVIFRRTTIQKINKAGAYPVEPYKMSDWDEIPARLKKKYPGDRYQCLEDVPQKVIARNTSAQFHSVWLTYKLPVPEQLHIVHLSLEETQTNIL